MMNGHLKFIMQKNAEGGWCTERNKTYSNGTKSLERWAQTYCTCKENCPGFDCCARVILASQPDFLNEKNCRQWSKVEAIISYSSLSFIAN